MKKVIRDNAISESFQVRQDVIPQHHNTWHYHDEIEFILILEGEGTFFIGDCITPFSAGDCVLIGSNVPHYWLFDEKFFSPEFTSHTNVIVAHFLKDFIGQVFWNLPEMTSLRLLIEHSKHGIMCEDTAEKLKHSFIHLKDTLGLERLIALLQTLKIFDQQQNKKKLISADYNIQHHDEDMNRMNIVLGFINENYKLQINLDEIANLSGMTKNSFCRYFKQKTGRTLTDFITKLRISNAQKILGDTHGSVKRACYESGFSNLVSFHKAFRTVTGTTPKAYKDIFRQKVLD